MDTSNQLNSVSQNHRDDCCACACAIHTGYVYSPFGAVTATLGNNPNVNPFRFSSEYLDRELGLIYYNYRHYNPTDGRWLSRDPIEERGGWNLYGMIRNNTINYTDYRGLTTTITTKDGDGNTEVISLPTGFTVDDLVAMLEKIKADGKNICKLKIYGHALSQLIFMNDVTTWRFDWLNSGHGADSGSVTMTAFNGVVSVYLYGENGEQTVQTVDITKLLGDLLGDNATIDLCGCNTASTYDPDNMTKKLSEIFKDILVRGSSGYMIGDPTYYTELAYRWVHEYINGKRADWRGRLKDYISDLCCPKKECAE